MISRWMGVFIPDIPNDWNKNRIVEIRTMFEVLDENQIKWSAKFLFVYHYWKKLRFEPEMQSNAMKLIVHIIPYKIPPLIKAVNVDVDVNRNMNIWVRKVRKKVKRNANVLHGLIFYMSFTLLINCNIFTCKSILEFERKLFCALCAHMQWNR